MIMSPRAAIILVSAAVAAAIILFVFTVVEVEPEFDQFERANEAFNMEQYDLAADILEPLATSGHQSAQEYMSYLEAFGLGRTIDRQKANDWAARFGARGERGFFECSIGIYWVEEKFDKLRIEEAAYWALYADELQGSEFCLKRISEAAISPAILTELSQMITSLRE
jgi:hypothetical protein